MNPLKEVHGQRWESTFAQTNDIKVTAAADTRAGKLLQKVFSQQQTSPEKRVLILSPKGKDKCIKLAAALLNAQTCDLLQSSEAAVKSYLEKNKDSLEKTGQWSTYLKTLESFACQKDGILDTYLKTELKECIKTTISLLKGGDKEDLKEQLCELMKSAFASSKSLDTTDLWILDQIPRLGLHKYLKGNLPLPLDTIQKAVFDLAKQINPYDLIDRTLPFIFKDLSLMLVDCIPSAVRNLMYRLKSTDFDQSHPSLFKGLATWLNNCSYEEFGEEAVRRIISAWLCNSTELDLSHLKLNKFPLQICELTNLKLLDLSNNNFRSIPPQISQLIDLQELSLRSTQLRSVPLDLCRLTNLEKLNLRNNAINSLPPEIKQLKKLKSLDLRSNYLHSLPSQLCHLVDLIHLDLELNKLTVLPNRIGLLTKLKKFNLSYNSIQLLPQSIGELTNLQMLDLSNNKFELLPPQIGQLLSLETLAISNNPNLKDLPMSLGNLSGITTLDTTGTSIPQSNAEAIVSQCILMRNKQTLKRLPALIKKWKTNAKSNADLSALESFADSQKMIIYEWLVRLEKTKDFANAQSSLAKIVCDMLKDVTLNMKFKELFLAQAEANNEACEDRAAMSLNEIFVTWKILNLPETATLAHKLNLMERAAKTLCMRNAITGLIKNEEQRKFDEKINNLKELGITIDTQMRQEIREQCVEAESVEIFLFYETELRAKLNLLSAIENMSYSKIGNRPWIIPILLEKYVNENFFEELNSLPIFEYELLQDPSIQSEMESIDDTFGEKLIALGECPLGVETDEVLEYKYKQGVIMQEQKRKKIDTARKWYKMRIRGK